MNTNSYKTNVFSSRISGAQLKLADIPEPDNRDDWPGVAPPAGWFLPSQGTSSQGNSASGSSAYQSAPSPQPATADQSPSTRSVVPAGIPANEPAPLPAAPASAPQTSAPRSSAPRSSATPPSSSMWRRSQQLWADSGIEWQRRPEPRQPEMPQSAHPYPAHPQPAPSQPAQRQHGRLLSQPAGRHAKPAKPAQSSRPAQPSRPEQPSRSTQPPRAPQPSRPAQAPRPVSVPAPRPAPAPIPWPAPVPRQTPSPYTDELVPERELAMAGVGGRSGRSGRSGTGERPSMAYVQFLGAPVAMAGQLPPAWPNDDEADEFEDDEPQQVPRAFGGGRRVAAIATPALVLGMVGALAVSLLTGHGPKFDQLSSHQANLPMGTGMAAAAFPTYPDLVQRGVFESLNRIVASGNTLVATAQRTVGSSTSQQFFVSKDGGTSWQLAPVHGNPGAFAPLLAGGPGGWLAVGPQAIWTSQDGRSWTLAAAHGVSQVPGDQVWVVTKTATGFLAGGSDAQSQGVVWISPDGLNWHRQIIGANVRNIAYATASGNDILVTGGLASGASGAWLSGDGGSTWSPVKIPGAGVVAGVAWNGSGFLAVRDNNAYFSPNGITWHSAGTIGGSGGLRARVVKGDSDGFVVTGQNAAGQLVAYLSTDNGASWRPTATLGNAAAESVVGAAVAPGENVIAFGATAATQVGQQPVFLDANGGAVHQIALPGGQAPELAVTALAASGTEQIAVGSANGYPAIWRKTGGGAWTLVTRPGQFGTKGLATLTSVTHGPAGWLAVGSEPSRSTLLLTSPDGVSWRTVGGTAVLAAADLLAAAAGPAGYVVAGQSGQVWFSKDLTTWAHVTGLGQVTGLAAGSHGFAAVGTAGRQPAVWTSADGKAWTRTGLSPAGATLRVVATVGNRIVVMGANAAGAPLAMLSVNDGATWQPVALPVTGLSAPVVTALAAEGTGFTALGESGQQLVSWASADGAVWTTAAG